MKTDKRVDVLSNFIFSMIIALVLTALAELINAGGLIWPAIAIDTLFSGILGLLIVLYLPFRKWGFTVASKHAEMGSTKFRVIMSGITAFPFATMMALIMSFIGTVLVGHLPAAIWGLSFVRVWGLFVAVAWLGVFFLIPPLIKLSCRILRVPEEQN